MSLVTYILLGVCAFGILLSFAWRFASRRRTLPCPSWLRWLVELDSPFARSNRASVIVEHLDLQPGMRVLDIGCGPGRLTIPMADKVGPKGDVVAIDIQPHMLRRAQEKAKHAGLSNISFHEVKMGDGKLDFGQFDWAILVTVLGEIPDREAALREVFSALKAGGVLSVTEVIVDPHFQGRATVLRLARSAGFREKRFFGNRFAFSLHLQKPTDA
jgi:ubiquinone/menaquinone biosynthesis C-methylase UbiE